MLVNWLCLLPAFIVFNRIRGGGMSGLTDKLPGRALYYVGSMYGLMALPFFGWHFAALVTVGFIAWGAPGWGLWFDLHRQDDRDHDDPRRSDWFVRIIDGLSGGSDHIALFWRHALLILPFLAGVGFLSGFWLWLAVAPVFGLIVVAAYEAGWRSGWSIQGAELMTGAIWWGLILAVAIFPIT